MNEVEETGKGQRERERKEARKQFEKCKLWVLIRNWGKDLR